MNIRKATLADSEQIADLIYRVALPFKSVDFTDIGWQFSCEYNSVDKVRERFLETDYLTLVCMVDEELVGLISIVNSQVISQLFVDAEYRYLGIAKQLWHKVLLTLRKENRQAGFKVKSSSFAVKFYEKLGFKVVAERQCSNGIWFIPMVMSEGNI